MKTRFIILAIACLNYSGFAQDKIDDSNSGEQKREKIMAQKIAFITSYLDLTADEAQVFWPVYNEYNKKLMDLSSDRMHLMKQVKMNTITITEKEAEIISDKIIEAEVNEASLKKEYHVKFKKSLPKIKVLKLYKAEHRFKKQLLREMKGMQHQHGKNQKADDE